MNENVKSNLKKYRSLIGLFLLCVIIAIATPRFLTLSNITNVLTQIAVNAIIAVGMSFVILTGGIDLSVGSTVALSGAVAASVVLSTGSIPLAIIAAIIVGAVIGLINGVLVSKGKLQAFIATLATMTIFRGETLVFTQGNPISKLPESFMVLGNGSLGFLPVPILITIIVAVIAIYALSQTKLGRYICSWR